MRAYELPVFNYVLRLTGDRALAEDLTQEVFLRVLQGLPGFSGRSCFTTWLFQIAKHRTLDEVRALERRPRSGGRVEDLDWPAAEPSADRRDAMTRLWEAVGELPVDLRTALLLRDVVGLTYREIGEVLEIPLSTVKWRIYAAREKVCAALGVDALIAAG